MTEYKVKYQREATDEQIKKSLLEFPLQPASMLIQMSLGLEEPRDDDKEGIEQYLQLCDNSNIIPFASEKIYVENHPKKELEVSGWGLFEKNPKIAPMIHDKLITGIANNILIKGLLDQERLPIIQHHLDKGYEFTLFTVSYGTTCSPLGHPSPNAYMGLHNPGELYLNGQTQTEDFHIVRKFMERL